MAYRQGIAYRGTVAAVCVMTERRREGQRDARRQALADDTADAGDAHD